MQVAYPLFMEKNLSPRRERRRAKLIQLLEANGGASNVARLTGTPKSYFSSLVRDVNPRGLGDDLAARLEQRFSKPAGWFDMSPELGGIPEAGEKELLSIYRDIDERDRETLLKMARALAPAADVQNHKLAA